MTLGDVVDALLPFESAFTTVVGVFVVVWLCDRILAWMRGAVREDV